MKQLIEKKNKEELLKEHRFILWMLFPTEESEAFWEHYIACYPEEKETLEEAKQNLEDTSRTIENLTVSENGFVYAEGKDTRRETYTFPKKRFNRSKNKRVKKEI